MERLTFEGNFCDIAQCYHLPCPHGGSCTQKQVWERLKQFEDTELAPEEVKEMAKMLMLRNNELLKLREGSRWIPVAERLPENQQRVLAFGRDNIVHDMVWDWPKDCWVDKLSRESYMEEFITCWMPLLESPEEMLRRAENG